jgi:hypothetical protein
VSEVGNPGGIVDHAASWKREPDVIVWRCVAPDDNQPGRRRGGPAERWSTVGFGWRAHAMALRPGRGGRGGEVVLCAASEQEACGSCSDQGQPTADPPPTSSPSTGQVWVSRRHARGSFRHSSDAARCLPVPVQPPHSVAWGLRVTHRTLEASAYGASARSCRRATWRTAPQPRRSSPSARSPSLRRISEYRRWRCPGCIAMCPEKVSSSRR